MDHFGPASLGDAVLLDNDNAGTGGKFCRAYRDQRGVGSRDDAAWRRSSTSSG